MNRSSAISVACIAFGLAVTAGVTEAVLAVSGFIASGHYPDGMALQILVRVLAYALGYLLVLLLRRGRVFAWWALLIFLGIVGLGSLVVPMIGDLAHGASAYTALGGDGGLAFFLVRVTHIVLVIIGVIGLLAGRPSGVRRRALDRKRVAMARAAQTGTLSSS
jgi:hypothetical protein